MTLVKHFSKNEKGRDLVVGDIHGCIDKFRSVLKACEFDKAKDRLFSVGDLVDRGPDSLGVLAFLEEPWFYAVRGNHEDMLCGVVFGEWDINNYYSNGGKWIDDLTPNQRREAAESVKNLPLAIVVGESPRRFNVLHAEFFGTDAELDAGNFTQHQQMQMLWGRSLISGHVETSEGLSLTIVGHTIRPLTQRVGSHLFIDTGSFLGHGRITIVEPATGREWANRPIP